MEICPTFIFKINSNCEKEIILLMIPNEEKEGKHYLAVRKLSALWNIIKSKHDVNFYQLSCLHTFRTENKIESQEKVCKNKYFCRIVMPSQKVNIIQFNQYTKSDKMSCIIYADIESLIKKIDKYANNLEESLPKIGDHAPCGYPFLTIWAFDTIANKHSLYCEEN